MKVFKLSLNDRRLHRSAAGYIVIFLLALLMSAAYAAAMAGLETDPSRSPATVGDFLLNFFVGDVANSAEGGLHGVSLPMLWIFTMFFLVSANIGYTQNDFSYFGYQAIARSGRRRRWWMAKCLSVFLNTVSQLGLLYLTILAVALLCGSKLCIAPSELFAARHNMGDITGVSTGELVLLIFILPTLSFFAMNLLQCFFGLFYRAEYGYLINAMALVGTVVIIPPLPYLLPQGFLATRFAPILPLESGGLEPLLSLAVSACTALLIVSVGFIKISGFDFIVVSGSGGRNEN